MTHRALPILAALWAAVAALAAAAPAAARQETDYPSITSEGEDGGLFAKVTLGNPSVEVGEAVLYTIDLYGPAIDSVRVPEVPATEAIDVIEREPARRNEGGGIFWRVFIATLESGEVAPGPLEVPYEWNGQARSLTVRFPAVKVASLVGEKADPAQFKDIMGEVVLDDPGRWLPWVAGGAAALVAAGALLWMLHRRKPAPAIAADAWAFAELDRLAGDAPHARGEFGAFYDGLTGIVRGYASRRFSIRAGSQTTREFLEAARAEPGFPDGETLRLRTLLSLADLVKFAAAKPDRAQCDAHLAEARAFVERTRPEPEKDASASDGAEAAG